MNKFKKRLRALSLFSNVGMAETFLDELGIDVILANELLKERAEFYKNLYPSVEVITGDITNKEVFNTIISKSVDRKVDFVLATPPCQGMSCAGRKDPNDSRNLLIFYAIEIIKKVKPKFAIIENVPMQQHTKILLGNECLFIPDYVEKELASSYNINTQRIINTKDYGVPQSRQRYIYLLSRKDTNLTWEFPKPSSHIITMKEAIGDLPSLDPLLREEKERWRFPDFELKKEKGLMVSRWHTPPTHSWKQVEWMMHTPTGTSAFTNSYYYPQTKGRRIKGAPRTYMRMFWTKPATTIMQNSGVISAFSTVHPGHCIVDSADDRKRIYSDARVLTIYELLILSSLPVNWNIPIWANDTLIRKVIGEGIPPLLIRKLIEGLIIGGQYDR